MACAAARRASQDAVMIQGTGNSGDRSKGVSLCLPWDVTLHTEAWPRRSSTRGPSGEFDEQEAIRSTASSGTSSENPHRNVRVMPCATAVVDEVVQESEKRTRPPASGSAMFSSLPRTITDVGAPLCYSDTSEGIEASGEFDGQEAVRSTASSGRPSDPNVRVMSCATAVVDEARGSEMRVRPPASGSAMCNSLPRIIAAPSCSSDTSEGVEAVLHSQSVADKFMTHVSSGHVCPASQFHTTASVLAVTVDPGGQLDLPWPDSGNVLSAPGASNTVHPTQTGTHGDSPSAWIPLVAREEPLDVLNINTMRIALRSSPSVWQVEASATSDPSVDSMLAPLLGGLLGGFFGLILIVAFIWYMWNTRCRPFAREDSIESQTLPTSLQQEYKPGERSSHQQSTVSTPPSYQYGVVGRPRSTLSMSASSPPHSPDPTRSRSHSPGPSVQSAYSRPPSMIMNTMMPPSPTPAVQGINTPISPGSSLAPSSRPPTPGQSLGFGGGYPFPLQQYHAEWQQGQGRVSWPRSSQSDDGHVTDPRRSPVLRPRSERRPSRLSLTLANWNPETDGMLGELEDGEGKTIVGAESDGRTAEATSESREAESRVDGAESGVDGAESGVDEAESGVDEASESQVTLTPGNAGPDAS